MTRPFNEKFNFDTSNYAGNYGLKGEISLASCDPDDFMNIDFHVQETRSDRFHKAERKDVNFCLTKETAMHLRDLLTKAYPYDTVVESASENQGIRVVVEIRSNGSVNFNAENIDE